MKNTRLTSILGSSLIACALTIGTLASTQSASAQSPTGLAEANIPFAFQTPSQTMPAGKYRIDRESTNLLRLEGPGVAGGFVVTHEAVKSHAPDHGVLVFERYGDTYYLRQIWTAGNNTGLECAKGRHEKESMLAKNKPAPSTIEVAYNDVPKQ
jgi:hypothetical protein